MNSSEGRILRYDGRIYATPASAYQLDSDTAGVSLMREGYKVGDVYRLYASHPPEEGPPGYEYLMVTGGDLVVTSLLIDGKTWMVDDPAHWWTICEQAREYSGNVVCAGLGLGLMAHALRANPKVEKITVIERDERVVQAISPFLGGLGVNLICADWHSSEWEEQAGEINGIYYDLLVGESSFGEGVHIMLGLYQRFPGATTRNILGHSNASLNDVARNVVNPRIPSWKSDYEQ